MATFQEIYGKPTMTEEQLELLVDKIPGEDGWAKISGKKKFVEAAKELNCKVLSRARVADILRELYWAVAEEYGH